MSLFLSHGAPTLAIEPTPAHRFLAGAGHLLDGADTLVVLSPHAPPTQHGVRVGTARLPRIVHDFRGWPAPLYELQYEPPGEPIIGAAVLDAYGDSNIPAAADESMPLDHGIWIPLMLLRPNADLPIVPLSLPPAATPAAALAAGRALVALDPGLRVIGSGSLTHDLHALTRAGDPRYVEFADWIETTLERGDETALLDYRRAAPHAALSHPTDEHLLPLFFALGAAGENWGAQRLHRSVDRNLVMDAYRFSSDDTPADVAAA